MVAAEYYALETDDVSHHTTSIFISDYIALFCGSSTNYEKVAVANSSHPQVWVDGAKALSLELLLDTVHPQNEYPFRTISVSTQCGEFPCRNLPVRQFV